MEKYELIETGFRLQKKKKKSRKRQTNLNEQHRKVQENIQGQLGRTKLQGQVNWYGWEVFLSGLSSECI